MPKNDAWIRRMAEKGMIEPFSRELKQKGVISSGVGSYGYDMRLHDEYKVLKTGVEGAVMDPKAADESLFEHFRGAVCTIPPNSMVLARSLEYFRLPREVLAICFGKSTYARSGVIVNVTPLEPEWEGYVTISISNTSPYPARLYSGEGIAQVIFLEARELCETSYSDRAGKYQGQQHITHSKTLDG